MFLPTLVIGYGSTLRRDDAVGVLAAERIQRYLEPEAAVQVISVVQLTPELAAPISQMQRVIFIDAAADAGVMPGTLRVLRLAADDARSAGVHHLTPAALLGLAMRLYGRSADGLLYTVQGDDFGLGEGLSLAVHAMLPGLIAQVLRCLETEQCV